MNNDLNELRLELATLIADANNFLMTLVFKGDQVTHAANILNRCNEMFLKVHGPIDPEASKEAKE